MSAHSYLYIYWGHLHVCIQLPVHILETSRCLYIVTCTYTGDIYMSAHSYLYIYRRHLDVCIQLPVHILVHITETSRCLYTVTCAYTRDI